MADASLRLVASQVYNALFDATTTASYDLPILNIVFPDALNPPKVLLTSWRSSSWASSLTTLTLWYRDQGSFNIPFFIKLNNSSSISTRSCVECCRCHLVIQYPCEVRFLNMNADTGRDRGCRDMPPYVTMCALSLICYVDPVSKQKSNRHRTWHLKHTLEDEPYW